MKKFLFITAAALLLVTGSACAQTWGYANVAVSNVPVKYVMSAPHNITLYNAGTNTLWANFGGNITGTTNDQASYYQHRFPIRTLTSYTTRDKYSVVSLLCSTGIYWATTFDVGFE